MHWFDNDYYWFDKPEPRAFRNLYVYLRTRIAISNSEEPIERLEGALRHKAFSLTFREHHISENGLLLKVRAERSAGDLANELSEPLSRFDAWAIIDDMDGFVESPSPGPLGHFADDYRPTCCAQLLIMWNTENPWTTKSVESVRSVLTRPSAPVFYFPDGQILMLASREAANITIQRCRESVKGLHGFCVIDSGGEIKSLPEHGHAWDWFGSWEPVNPRPRF